MRFDAIVDGTIADKNEHGQPAPMEKIVTIAYTSRAAAEFATREARHRLKFFAQTQNVQVGITGMLVYCEGVFVQAIEGPLRWCSLYARIAKKMPAMTTLSCLRARRVTHAYLMPGVWDTLNLKRRRLQ